MAIILAASVGLLVFICALHRRASRKQARPCLPPGPRPLPLLGNFMDLPPRGVPECQHWLKHKDAYGPVSSITVLGQRIVIIHDRQTAHDVMEKRSAKSADRPETVFASKLCGYGELTGSRYDDLLRRRRHHFHEELGTKALVARSNDVQELEGRRFLVRVLNRPDTPTQQLRATAGAIILRIAYGYCIEPHDPDPLVSLMERSLANITLAIVPLAWIVDLIPALLYLPDGWPGTAFKETARRWRRINKASIDMPYAFVRRQMATGSFRPSYVSRLLQQYSSDTHTSFKIDAHDELAIKLSAASMYIAGGDATVIALSSFILAMVMFPEVQRKAQAELDRHVGPCAVPRLEHRQKLPYIEALVKEVFRWSPVSAFGIPHLMTDDTTTHDGYTIPKVSILLPAIRWFCHDPETHAEPGIFDPARFLEPRNEPDPKEVVFGYGRRVCPGRFLADSTTFLAVVQLLSVFNIRKAVDGDGNEIEVKLEVKPGMINHVVDFPHRVEPRSEKHAALVRGWDGDQLWEESDSGLVDADEIWQCLGESGGKVA